MKKLERCAKLLEALYPGADIRIEMDEDGKYVTCAMQYNMEEAVADCAHDNLEEAIDCLWEALKLEISNRNLRNLIAEVDLEEMTKAKGLS